MKQLVDIIQRALTEALANTHTATVGRVVKVNEKTVDIQPVINAVFNGADVKLPVFAEVPLVTLQGGSSYLHMPVAVGDYALVVFTERSFDRWYAGTDEVRPPELRMHDYSDGFAIVGINPLDGAITIPGVITMIGDALMNGNHEHNGNLTRVGDETVTGDRTHTGNITVTAQISAATSVLGAASFTTIESGGNSGVTGTFQKDGGGTITVTNGIITGIA